MEEEEVLAAGMRRLTVGSDCWELAGLACGGGKWQWRVSSRTLLEVYGWGKRGAGWCGRLRRDAKPAVHDTVEVEGVGVCSRLTITGCISGCGAPPLVARVEFALPADSCSMLWRVELTNTTDDLELETISLLDASVTVDDSSSVKHSTLSPDPLTILSWSFGVFLVLLPLAIRLQLSWAASLFMVLSGPYYTARYGVTVRERLMRPDARWTWRRVLISGYQVSERGVPHRFPCTNLSEEACAACSSASCLAGRECVRDTESLLGRRASATRARYRFAPARPRCWRRSRARSASPGSGGCSRASRRGGCSPGRSTTAAAPPRASGSGGSPGGSRSSWGPSCSTRRRRSSRTRSRW